MADFIHLKQHTLSIRLSTEGFAFSIHDAASDDPPSVIEKKVDVSISMTANLKKMFRETDFLNSPYKLVNVIITGKRFTIVPLELFEEEQAKLLFYYNQPKQENEIVVYNTLQKNDVVVIFGIDKSVYNFLKEQYPGVHFYSHSTPLIKHFSAKSKWGNCKKMYASIRKDAVDVYCFERERLLLANSFECNCTADRIYYLLYCWKQQNFSQEWDELHLWGTLPDKKALTNELKEFIQRVLIIDSEANIDMQVLLSCE